MAKAKQTRTQRAFTVRDRQMALRIACRMILRYAGDQELNLPQDNGIPAFQLLTETIGDLLREQQLTDRLPGTTHN